MLAPSLRRMIEPLPYSFSMVATARSMALLLFFGSSMARAQTYTGYLFRWQVGVSCLCKALGIAVVTGTRLPGEALSGCDDDAPKRKPPEPAPGGEPRPLPRGRRGRARSGRRSAGACGRPEGGARRLHDGRRLHPARAAGDPLLGDALEAIGYDTFLRDACRLLDAAKNRDAKRCSEVTASALRGKCVATVAELTSNPDACPFDFPSKPDLGRDATCLAVASHDAELCAGALEWTTPVTCRALATHDADACKKLAQPADRTRCARDVQRWSAVLPAAAAPSRDAGVPSGTVTLTGDGGGLGSEAFPIDVSRGVVVLERLEGPHFVVGKLTASGLELVQRGPGDPKPFMMEVRRTVQSEEGARRAAAARDCGSPGGGPRRLEGERPRVKVARFERKRGAPLELTVEGPSSRACT